MKRMLAAVLLLISGLIYIIAAITQKDLYLQKFSIEADNPVSFDGYSIKIDTNFQPARMLFISCRCTDLFDCLGGCSINHLGFNPAQKVKNCPVCWLFARTGQFCSA